jgi:pilus assembly protein CpaB
MKKPRLLAAAIAATASVFVMLMVFKKPAPKPAPLPVAAQNTLSTTEILVVRGDIGLGRVITAGDLAWQKWPLEAMNPQFISRATSPRGLEDMSGAVARGTISAGEPLRLSKIVKSGSRSVMSAILTAGMRAVSIPVNQEVGVGGFILPNDRLDIIMVRRLELSPDPRLRTKDDPTHQAQTIITNARVLAADQVVEEKTGEKSILARTVTLELTPEQAETVALARNMGILSVSLRSIADQGPDKVAAGEGNESDEGASGLKKKSDGKMVNVIRFGHNQPAASK